MKAETLWLLGGLYYTSSHPLGAEFLLQGLIVAQQIEDIYLTAEIMSHLGLAYIYLGLFDKATITLEQALARFDKLGNHGILRIHTLQGLALILLYKIDQQSVSEQLGAILRELEPFDTLEVPSYIYANRAIIKERINSLEDAIKLYEQKLDDAQLKYESLAGLLRIYFAKGNWQISKLYTDELWRYLIKNEFDGLYPILTYLTCVNVFAAVGDTETSKAALEAGYKFLMERAEKITNPEWKKSYLENFPEHREIVAKWQELHYKG